MFSKPIYNNIKYPQPQYNRQSASITRLPSFSEVITQIPLPTEFPLSKPAGVSVTPVSVTPAISITPGIGARSLSPASPYPVSYYYSYGYGAPTVAAATAPSVSPARSPPPTMTAVTSTSTTTSTATSPKAIGSPVVIHKRKHVCKICSRSFTTSGHLARHNRIHTGERKHVCPWSNCDARFARQDNCMQHYKTHTNGKKRKNNLSFKNRSINSKSI
ncbi:hypothetical protein CANTEDRAFT_113769 [Yamadazyma tenuis ATCC 10573]|uniref:C2H2-type domain-containing protein n=1 Tax=Candida tenuis (strain ATCC 10573 / BCRC 21748 / CBS 615 / JCM 9827 / NBRC 10315 / NRRL Y-1498 / VKM Y-70) TaxID=590646 RepID=G3B3T9_CANTC|nr:uncharacterized protein CANTEDRAFT_113769 [Yamadazyma tenuis ATCC 10573]EGV64225.1 hypothetical protein CANTEDRAFT_113769 [Yamadazyma tenuis ATCC 10573]